MTGDGSTESKYEGAKLILTALGLLIVTGANLYMFYFPSPIEKDMYNLQNESFNYIKSSDIYNSEEYRSSEVFNNTHGKFFVFYPNNQTADWRYERIMLKFYTNSTASLKNVEYRIYLNNLNKNIDIVQDCGVGINCDNVTCYGNHFNIYLGAAPGIQTHWISLNLTWNTSWRDEMIDINSENVGLYSNNTIINTTVSQMFNNETRFRQSYNGWVGD